MSLRAYDNYKDTGVEWLGKVPSHWTVDRIKRSTLSVKNGVWGHEPCDDANDIACVRVADFDRQKGRVWLADPTIRNVPENDRVGRILQQDDLLLEKSGGGETQPVGFVVLYDDPRPAVCSNFVARVQLAAAMHPGFWRYLHSAAYSVRLNTRSIKQTSGIQNLDAQQYLDEPVTFPPFDEQIAIAGFLDRETAKIDALVAEQLRLIDLLKEKRQAVISHAVTKGINPSAPMKPSGIPWLGEVPAHWSVAPIASRYQVQLGKMLDATTITGEYLRPYLRVFDVQWGEINTSDLPEMDFDEAARAKFLLAAGDLLVNEGGSYPGRSAIWSAPIDECYYQKALHRMRAFDPTRDTTEFLFYLMYWAANQGVFVSGGNETTIEHLPAEKLRRYRFPFPSLSEQLAISVFLDSEVAKTSGLLAESQCAVDLLLERRAALIFAAVTGQIDVRGLLEPVAA